MNFMMNNEISNREYNGRTHVGYNWDTSGRRQAMLYPYRSFRQPAIYFELTLFQFACLLWRQINYLSIYLASLVGRCWTKSEDLSKWFIFVEEINVNTRCCDVLGAHALSSRSILVRNLDIELFWRMHNSNMSDVIIRMNDVMREIKASLCIAVYCVSLIRSTAPEQLSARDCAHITKNVPNLAQIDVRFNRNRHTRWKCVSCALVDLNVKLMLATICTHYSLTLCRACCWCRAIFGTGIRSKQIT